MPSVRSGKNPGYKSASAKKTPARPTTKPELLAPAGNVAAFAAAVEAGADAVYLGMKTFSARAYAANFTLDDLSRLTPLAHDRNVKIFVAFNSLIKEEDLPQAARLLDGLARIGPDALILQDLGLLRLARKHFPMFELHASTLAGGHNLPGLIQMKRAGFDRAVLARELTIKEIQSLAAAAPLGLEVFVHGALCFSFSGLCLMSSFLGGRSSLRGACTQPCRRRYSSQGKSGYYFSPTDLDASGYIRHLRALNLAAFKIEGRMKGPHYVSQVVKAYRLLLDAPDEAWEEAFDEARGLLAESLGRSGSTGFFSAPQPTAALAPNRAPTSGVFLGPVTAASETEARLNLRAGLAVGDRLRLVSKRDGEQRAFTLKSLAVNDAEVSEAAAGADVVLPTAGLLASGDLLFKVDDGLGEREALAGSFMTAFKKTPAPSGNGPSPSLKRVLAAIDSAGPGRGRAGRSPGRTPEIWCRVFRPEDSFELAPLRPDRIILPLNRSNQKRLLRLRRKLQPFLDRLVWALPPLLFGRDLEETRFQLAGLRKGSGGAFLISNLGHLGLLEPLLRGRGSHRPEVYADHRLSVLNTQAEAELAELGLSGLTLCLESDEENLGRILARPGPVDRLIYLYGRPPLFTSRFRLAGLKDRQAVVSPKRERFQVKQEPGLTQVTAERPIFLAPLLKTKPLNGVRAWIVDLEFEPHIRETVRRVAEAVRRGRPLPGASRFNLGRELY